MTMYMYTIHIGIHIHTYIYIDIYIYYTCIYLVMEHGFAHAAWTCSCSMSPDNGLAWMAECLNADKKFSRALLSFY
jgi:hypothetical protein